MSKFIMFLSAAIAGTAIYMGCAAASHAGSLAWIDALLGAKQAHAVVIDSGDNGVTFFTLKGEKMTAREAYGQDGKFLKCTVVEVHYNGTTGRPTIKK